MKPTLDFFLAEFKQEATLTRSFLAKVPMEKASYQPHKKSETLGRMAIHVAEIIAWWKNVLEEKEMDFAGFEPEKIESTVALLSYFDKLYAQSINAFATGDEQRGMLMGVKRFTKHEPLNTKDYRQAIAQKLITEADKTAQKRERLKKRSLLIQKIKRREG